MLKRNLPRVGLGAGALALSIAAFGTATASAHYGLGDQSSGHVYVNDNTTGSNTIAAFDRHSDGSLTPIPGSPFPAGGAGTGAGLASQGAIQQAGDGFGFGGSHYLLAVDAASNQVSVLRTGYGGAPELLSTAPSGGVDPVSIAVSGPLVYVANAGAAEPNVSVFWLAPWGHLYQLAHSTVALPSGSGPDDVVVDPTGRRLVVPLVNSSQIASFHIGWGGRLTAAPGSPFTAQGPGPFGSEFRPTDPSQLFVSNAHGGAGKGTVSAFSVSEQGILTSIGSSPFADEQTAPCWVEISHDGRYLFAVNTASGSISSYAIAPGGSLELLGSVGFGVAGAGAVDARLSPDGSTLYVNGSKANVVAGFAVTGGTVTPLASSPTPLPAGAVASGIVVD